MTQAIEASLRRGHPWVFHDAVRLHPGTSDGDVVLVRTSEGKPVGTAIAEPSSGLQLRMWSLSHDGTLDTAALATRLEEAAAWRRATLPPDVTGYRLCHGENDGVPGLHADVYGDVLALRTDGRMGLRWRDRFIHALKPLGPWRAIVHRNPLHNEGKAQLLEGSLDGLVEMQEGARRYWVDVLHGQKTGFFCDQRENRDLLQSCSAGADVLNLFAYTGGFSVAAALGGARRVTTVDLAAPAIALASQNMTLNQVDPGAHVFAAEDAFGFLDRAEHHQQQWDIVVVDPPSFTNEKEHVDRALRAYERLNAAALRRVLPGGLLATASCSSRITEDAFLGMLARAASRQGLRLAVTAIRGAGADHPVSPSFPEGRYLKFVLARVLPSR